MNLVIDDSEMLYELCYTESVLENLEYIKKDKILFGRYKELKKQLEKNSHIPNFPEAKMPEYIKIPNDMQEQFHYIELTNNVRILYQISGNNCYIYSIDIDNM